MKVSVTIMNKYLKKSNYKLIREVIKQFYKMNPLKLEYISLDKCKKLVKNVNLDINYFPMVFTNTFTLNEVLEIVFIIKTKSSHSEQLKEFFINNNLKMKFPTLFIDFLKDKGVISNESKNELEFLDIEKLFK